MRSFRQLAGMRGASAERYILQAMSLEITARQRRAEAEAARVR